MLYINNALITQILKTQFEAEIVTLGDSSEKEKFVKLKIELNFHKKHEIPSKIESVMAFLVTTQS